VEEALLAHGQPFLPPFVLVVRAPQIQEAKKIFDLKEYGGLRSELELGGSRHQCGDQSLPGRPELAEDGQSDR
jgi:hypothetical protein